MSTPPAPYPLSIRGEVDPLVGRWLWLIKWLLVIPHMVVLGLLWSAAIIATVIAFFAILFTARYPRGLFDFNVGVLRWSWRLAFYGAQGFATDRYPPFTLQPRADYPADLAVAYPERLSRGLILVKWWLLAVPHLLIVGVLRGVGGSGWGGGLISLLSLFGAIALLFTGRYPRDIFALVVGLNRWSYRVAAYVLLMTDEYPPFRLETQEREEASAQTA